MMPTKPLFASVLLRTVTIEPPRMTMPVPDGVSEIDPSPIALGRLLSCTLLSAITMCV
jgi:hypothetical protein